MICYYFVRPVWILLFVGFFISCNQSDEQRKFENEALSLPENFTETNNSGAIVNDNKDPDDWRIAPFFQGVVYVDPPFPNPLLTNERLSIYIHITGVDAVNGLRVLAFFNESSFRLLYEDPGSQLPTGLSTITLDALDITRFNENAQGLYRIIIEDRQGTIITYGDIKIE